jgi:hypothetical protein
MNIFKKLVLVTFVVLSFTQQAAHAQMDPKVKALGTMAVYGTVGGALLGTAALAFDAGGRSPAIGASLGLYLGLIFGGYVVTSHAMKKRSVQDQYNEENYYPDTQSSPYEDPGAAAPLGEPEAMNLNQLNPTTLQALYDSGPSQQSFKNDVKTGPVYYVQLMNLQF